MVTLCYGALEIVGLLLLLLFSFVRGQDSSMWDIVWVSPQGHRSVSGSRHFLPQAPQCPCSVRNRPSRDHRRWGRPKPDRQTVGPHTRWEPTTRADLQPRPHRLLTSTGHKSSHNASRPLNNTDTLFANAQQLEDIDKLVHNNLQYTKVYRGKIWHNKNLSPTTANRV